MSPLRSATRREPGLDKVFYRADEAYTGFPSEEELKKKTALVSRR